jgi:hypothetical protein
MTIVSQSLHSSWRLLDPIEELESGRDCSYGCRTMIKVNLGYTILRRTDTNEYLSHFLFFMPDPPIWTRDPDEAFPFRTHSDAESNARLILERLGDPTNTKVRLRIGDEEGMYPVNVWRSK